MVCHLETLCALQSFGMAETHYDGVVVAHKYLVRHWALTLDISVVIDIVEGLARQSLPNGSFRAGVHIKTVAQVARYHHIATLATAGQFQLRIAELWPRGAGADARQLDIEERQIVAEILAKGFAPTLHQYGEKFFVQLHVVGIRLALIPSHTSQAVAHQRFNASLEKVSRVVGMAL